MKLNEYLRDNKIGEAAFAARLGVSQQTVNRYLRGERFPRRTILARITELTAGAVTSNDFVGHDMPKGEAA